jgi:DNA-binding transcriptional LysR family regulator
MWETIELRELRIFLTLAEELHFARTAERLNLSQSRVSQAIRTLETKTGGALFQRTSRRVALTPLGQRMHAEVGPAYGRLREAFEDTRDRATGITGTVRLGIYRNALNAGPYLTEIVRTFTHEQHPASTVEFVDVGSMADSLGSLRSGHVDMITARLPLSEPDITVGPILARQRRVLLVARHDELSSRDAINYDEIGDRPVGTLRTSMPTELRDAFIPPTSAAGRVLARAPGTLGTPTEINMQVALGSLVHVTVEGWTERHHHPDVVAVPIRDLPPSETALAWLTNLTSPRTSAFISTAREVLAHTELAGKILQAP